MTEHSNLLPVLRDMGLVGADETPAFIALTGGVASDIWRVDAARGPFCIKRALAKLKVAADWRAPVERNAYEVGWLRAADRIVPGAAPAVLGHAPDEGLFAMAWLDPDRHPVWKAELLAGRADPDFAAKVGDAIGRIHAATAGRDDMAATFPTDAVFWAIRLEPYLIATATAHPDLAGHLRALAERTHTTKRTLVHGDVSPKNILVGPTGPVFLDAECAWYGDPAFDVAFCLNHLLLKCVPQPGAAPTFLAAFDALADAWLARIDWEPAAEAEARAATLLPALTLARIDGKSPVEYITDTAAQDRVRTAACRIVQSGADTLAAVRAAWNKEIAA